MKYRHLLLLGLFLFSCSFIGCATVFTGYEDNVMLTNIPAELKIFDKDNIELPIRYKTNVKQYYRGNGAVFDSTFITGKYISLRSNEDHLLTLKTVNETKQIRLYPKLSAGWFILDVVTLTFIVDMYTGNWNHFDDINFKNIQ